MEWFESWFDTKYYHILYQDRNDTEAQLFMDNLTEKLHFKTDQTFLDLACGKGRHSVYLNQKNLNIVGIDLSEASIKYAQQFENERLKFYTHDMREPFREGSFDFVLNLFTSFGYFKTNQENAQAILAMAQNLRKGGRLVLDFFNTSVVQAVLPYQETKKLNGIDFEIHKRLENGFVTKDIRFQDQGQAYYFQEKVQAISYTEFSKYFKSAGLQVLEVFGNYELKGWNPTTSPRMIWLLQKP